MGTPEVMYDESGEKTWECTLNSYGKVRNFKGEWKSECPFRYQGQYEDAETGLYYNRFRYYSPDEGMYISQDPIRLLGGDNLYGYVYDFNKFIDPFGLFEEKVITDGNVYRGGTSENITFYPSSTDLANSDTMPGISTKPKDNNSTRKFFKERQGGMYKIDVTKLNNLEAVQDGKDHVSIRPTQAYLEKKNLTMDEALQDWHERGAEHPLSKEIEEAAETETETSCNPK